MKKLLVLFLLVSCCYAYGQDTSKLQTAKQQSDTEIIQKSKFYIGFGISHLYDIYEGPKKLTDAFGVTFKTSDLDLKGLNGDYTKFDVGVGLLAEIQFNEKLSTTLAYTNGVMTSQYDNQYASTKLNLINIGIRRYFKPDKENSGFKVIPYGQVGIGASYYLSDRYFVKDEGLFSQTEGLAITNTISVGCLFSINPKLKINVTPNFIIHYSDGVDGYNYKGADIMMSTTLGILFQL